MNWLSTIAESAKEALEDAAIAAAEIRATATAPDRNGEDDTYNDDDDGNENGSEARAGNEYSPYHRYKRKDLSIATANTSDYMSMDGKDSTSDTSSKRINKVLDINISLSDDEDEDSNKPRIKSPSLLNDISGTKIQDNQQSNKINKAESIPYSTNSSSNDVDVNRYDNIIRPKIIEERAPSPARITSPAGYDSDYLKALMEENETLKKRMKETADHYENELAQAKSLIVKSNQIERQSEEWRLKENELKEAIERQHHLENENDILRNKLNNYETESEKHSQLLNTLKQEIVKNQNQINQLENDKSKQSQKLTVLENEKSGLLKQIEELKLYSQSGSESTQSSSDNNDGSKAIVDRYELQIHDLRNQIAILEAEKVNSTSQLEAELDSYKQQVETLKIENESQKSEIVKVNEENLKLKSSLEDITNKFDGQDSINQKSVQDLQVQFTQIKEWNEKLSEEIKILNEEKEQKIQHIKELQNQLEINTPQQNIETIKGELALAYEEKMEALKKKAKEKLSLVSDEYSAIQKQYNDLATENDELKSKNRELEKIKSELFMNVQELDAALKRSEKIISEIEGDFELAKNDVETLAQEVARLQEDNRSLIEHGSSKIKGSEDQITKLNSELMKMKEDYLNLLNESSQTIEKLRQELNLYVGSQQELNLARGELAATQADLRVSERERQNAISELQDLQGALKRLTEEMERLEGDSKTKMQQLKNTMEQSKAQAIEYIKEDMNQQIEALMRKVRSLEDVIQDQTSKIAQLEEKESATITAAASSSSLLSDTKSGSLPTSPKAADSLNHTMIDRAIATKLIVTYFARGSIGGSQAQREVLEMMSKILEFTQEERKVVGLEKDENNTAAQGVINAGLGLLMGKQGLQLAKENAKKSAKIVEEKSFEDLFAQFVSGEL